MSDEPALHPILNAGGPLPEAEQNRIRENAVQALQTVYDPEIPVDIYQLGLVYRLEVSGAGSVLVEMTLTSPACPVAGSLPGEVEAKLKSIPGVTDVQVQLVWDPPWTMDRMSEAARLELGLL